MDGWLVRELRAPLPATRANSSDLSRSLPAAVDCFVSTHVSNFQAGTTAAERHGRETWHSHQVHRAQGRYRLITRRYPCLKESDTADDYL